MGSFSILIPGRVSVRPFVSSWEVVLCEERWAGCSVISVRREDPVAIRIVLFANGCTVVGWLYSPWEVPVVRSSAPVVPSGSVIETLVSRLSLGCNNEGVEESEGNTEGKKGHVGGFVDENVGENVIRDVGGDDDNGNGKVEKEDGTEDLAEENKVDG